MKYCLSLFLLSAFHFLSAQSVERQLSATAGGSFSGTFQMDWSIGETVVTTGAVGSVLLNQGFHQMQYSSPSNGLVQVLNSLQIWPNPCQSSLNLQSTARLDGSHITVMNTLGSQVAAFNWLGGEVFNADVSALAPGTYLLVLESTKQRTVFKFSKI